MAKRSAEKGGAGVKEAGALKHSPFAGLAGLEAPPGPAPAPTPQEEPPAAASPRFAPKVVVRREKKGRRGKTVTRITGVSAAHREAVRDGLKKALGCGGTLEGDDVLLLGALVDRAADWLESEGAGRVVRS